MSQFTTEYFLALPLVCADDMPCALDAPAVSETSAHWPSYRDAHHQRREVSFLKVPMQVAYHSWDAYAKGQKSEQLFISRAAEAGMQCFALPHATFNYRMHVDFEVQTPDGKCFWVDVKAPRALRTSKDPHDLLGRPQNNFVCLEIGDGGWLFSGYADAIAFGRTDGHFVVVDRKKLAAWTLDRLQSCGERVAWPEQSLMRPYVRSSAGRSVALMYVPIADLRDCVVGYL